MSTDSRDLYERLAKVSEQAAVASERERQLEEKVDALEAEMASIRELVARGRGVLLVLLSLGSLLGILVGGWDRIAKIFWGH